MELCTKARRGWKKLHLGVDHAGVIVAQALTASAVDDASTGIDLIETIASSARTVTADAAYDTLAFYETAKLSRRNPRSSARDGTISRISKIGRRRWKQEVGYHRQARVENAFFRYTSMLGDRLRRRTRAAQAVESVRACNGLNRMTELGRPESFAIGDEPTRGERSGPVSICATTPQKAHHALDRAVDRFYCHPRFASERERVEYLFALYERLQAPLVAAVGKGTRRLQTRRGHGEQPIT